MSCVEKKIQVNERVVSTFNYSREQRRIYNTNPFENKIIFLNEDLLF